MFQSILSRNNTQSSLYWIILIACGWKIFKPSEAAWLTIKWLIIILPVLSMLYLVPFVDMRFIWQELFFRSIFCLSRERAAHVCLNVLFFLFSNWISVSFALLKSINSTDFFRNWQKRIHLFSLTQFKCYVFVAHQIFKIHHFNRHIDRISRTHTHTHIRLTSSYSKRRCARAEKTCLAN